MTLFKFLSHKQDGNQLIIYLWEVSMKHEIRIHNGTVIPELGYRIDRDNKKTMYEDILTALRAGFRHFDIACDAETERIAGKAFADSGVPRFELFLTMKLGNEDHGYERAARAFEKSLKHVGTDYADLYLINWPNPIQFRDRYATNSVDTWRALESIYKSGRARAIGVANYEARHIEFLLDHAEIAPMVNQARIYPGFPFKDNLDCAHEHNILTEGFLPPMHDDILNSKELKIFAGKYKVSPRMICIRYLLEKKCIALLQGRNEEELRNTVKAFDFTISPEDMLYLDAMKNYGLENINPDTCDF
ncbi:MAG TPA: 2,5-diketo-D-gluconic acid reductase [Erysipelotrichaceae bacterium]|nr:2,5-diketo-D-gluconic acid reductase [Erysipelotrichaceae bacterium]